MLIIFDLDDTLIDTSGAITPFKMKECLKKLGFLGGDFQELWEINQESMSSKEAFGKFFAKRGAPIEWVKRAMEEMVSPLPEGFSVPTTPNAKEILEFLKGRFDLALVTGGHPPFQMEKLEKAGIDRSFFSKIAIPEDSIKKPFYKGLLEEFSKSPEEVLVCGDRIAMDLAPAHELGCVTVHMRWGRGRIGKQEPWITHAIRDLSELKRIVER